MPESKWKRFERGFFFFFGVLTVLGGILLLRGSAQAYLALTPEEQHAAVPGMGMAFGFAMLWGAMTYFRLSRKEKEVVDDVSG